MILLRILFSFNLKSSHRKHRHHYSSLWLASQPTRESVFILHAELLTHHESRGTCVRSGCFGVMDTSPQVLLCVSM